MTMRTDGVADPKQPLTELGAPIQTPPQQLDQAVKSQGGNPTPGSLLGSAGCTPRRDDQRRQRLPVSRLQAH
jgi:hypothetical protein